MDKLIGGKVLHKAALVGMVLSLVLLAGCDTKRAASPGGATEDVDIDETNEVNDGSLAENSADDTDGNSVENAGGNTDANGSQDDHNDGTSDNANAGNNTGEQAVDGFDQTIFGIKIGDEEIHLRDKKSQEDIVVLLGVPLQLDEETLGPNSDTLNGSLLQKLHLEVLDQLALVILASFYTKAEKGVKPFSAFGCYICLLLIC